MTSTLTPIQTSRLALLAIPVGIAAALSATLFLWLVERGQELFWLELPHVLGLHELPWWWAAFPLALGTAVVAIALRMPGATGGGPLGGYHFNTPLAHVPSVLLAALGSLVAGFALGPEAPLIVAGTTIALILTRRAGVPVQHAAMFIGGIAAVGAVFGSPLVTMVMLLEFMAVGAAPVVLLIPTLVGLASSYLVQIGIWNIPGVGVHSLTVPNLPDYPSIESADILVAIVTAIVAGVVALIVRETAFRVERFSRTRRMLGLALAGAGTFAAIAIGIGPLGLDPKLMLFSGNAGIPVLVAETSLAVVIAVVVLKGIITVLSLGGGLRGGAIFPATLFGVAVGMFCHLLVPESGLPAAIATGIAVSAAVFTKLPATSALLAVLLISGTGPAVAPFAIGGAVIGTLMRLFGDQVTDASTTSAA